MKIIIIMLLLLFATMSLDGCTVNEKSSSDSAEISSAAATSSHEIPSLNSNSETGEKAPYIITEEFKDNITENMINEDLFGNLIYRYNNMIIPTDTGQVNYADALDYFAFYGSMSFKEIGELREQLPESDFYEYRLFDIDADVVESYLCSIFNTEVDRSAFCYYLEYDAEKNVYSTHFRPSSFFTDVDVLSIENESEEVYVIRADFCYLDEIAFNEVERIKLLEQIFRIQIKDGEFRYLSVEYLYINVEYLHINDDK